MDLIGSDEDSKYRQNDNQHYVKYYDYFHAARVTGAINPHRQQGHISIQNDQYCKKQNCCYFIFDGSHDCYRYHRQPNLPDSFFEPYDIF